MTGGVSGGHFIGFFSAVLLLAVLIVVATRPAVIQRVGSWRWPMVGLVVLGLVLLACFGSGTREISFRTAVGPLFTTSTLITQEHVDAALAEVTRPEFVQYIARIEGAGVLVDEPERLRGALSARAATTVDVQAEGYRFDSPPKVGRAWLLVSYVERENPFFAPFGPDDGLRRMVLGEIVVSKVLPQAVALAALRTARNDRDKLAILNENPFVVPYAAEWLADELDELAAGASAELQPILAQKRAYVRQCIDNPVARGMNASPPPR